MKKLLVLALVLSFVGSAFAQEPPAAFERNCMQCHGIDGKGNTAAAKKMNIPNLGSAEVQKLNDQELYATIAYGAGHLQYPHAFASKGVDSVAIHQIITFIRSLRTTK